MNLMNQNTLPVLETKDGEAKKLSRQLDVYPKAIKQRHIDGLITFRGAIVDRPANGDTEIQVYFAEDESKLYIWNTENETWESTTMS